MAQTQRHTIRLHAWKKTRDTLQTCCMMEHNHIGRCVRQLTRGYLFPPTAKRKGFFCRRHACHILSSKGHSWPMKVSLHQASRRNQQLWPSSPFGKTSLSARHSPHRPWISKDPANDTQHHAAKVIQQTNQPLLIVCPPLNIKTGHCVLTWEPLAFITTFPDVKSQTNNATTTDECENINAKNKRERTAHC